MDSRRHDGKHRRRKNHFCSALSLRGAMFVAMACSMAMGDSPADRFVASLDGNAAITSEVAGLIRESWSQCKDCDGAEFITQGLAVFSDAFRSGLDAYEADEYAECAEVMGGLRADSNPFIALHAAAYEVKALVALNRLIDAGERLAPLVADLPSSSAPIALHTYFAPELSFLDGYCLLSDLQYDAAEIALTVFEREYPDASQRLRVAAQQMLAELANREPGKIAEVVDLMNFAGRRLENRSGDEVVQQRQQRIIDLLDKMIEDAQQQESSSSSSSSSSGGGDGDGSKPKSPQNPAEQSQLPQGGPAQGPMQDSRRIQPGEKWGAMPPAERERILQALRDSFPRRYRRLVEQYYEQLGKQ